MVNSASGGEVCFLYACRDSFSLYSFLDGRVCAVGYFILFSFFTTVLRVLY